MNKIKIALVDDHNSVRRGTELMIEKLDNISIEISVENGNEFLKAVRETPVDAVLMDIEMPFRNGAETTKILSINHPEIKVIAYTLHREKSKIYEMLKAGAKGFVWKGCDPEELEAAIKQTVLKGKTYIGKNILEDKKVFIIKYGSNQKIAFTGREGEVFREVVNGLTAKQIGEKLKISEKTVEKHKRKLFSKTGTNSAIGLVIYGVTNGYYKTL